jgi:hypothetical protein
MVSSSGSISTGNQFFGASALAAVKVEAYLSLKIYNAVGNLRSVRSTHLFFRIQTSHGNPSIRAIATLFQASCKEHNEEH